MNTLNEISETANSMLPGQMDVLATPTGMMALIYSIDARNETDYLHWVTREHMLERVTTPGFHRARLFRNTDTAPETFFTMYTLDNASVMSSAAYLERLNNPTPWTRRVMPMLKNMARGGGTVVHQEANGEGGRVAVLRLDRDAVDHLSGDTGAELVSRVVSADKIVAARLLNVAKDATEIKTNEKAIRGEDDVFDGLFIIEGLNDDMLKAVATIVRDEISEAGIGAIADARLFTAIFSRTKPAAI